MKYLSELIFDKATIEKILVFYCNIDPNKPKPIVFYESHHSFFLANAGRPETLTISTKDNRGKDFRVLIKKNEVMFSMNEIFFASVWEEIAIQKACENILLLLRKAGYDV